MHASRFTRLLLIATLFGAVASAPAAAKPKPSDKDKAAAAAAASAEKPFTDWKKLTKDAERKPGFMTLWRKRDNLYLELSKDEFEKPFLYITSLSRGIGSNFVLGGLPHEDRMLQWERHGDRVLLVQLNPYFPNNPGKPIDQARDLSIPNSVLAGFKIESEHDSSKAVIIDLASMLVSDASDMGERLRQSFGNVSVRFDKDRSSLGSVKTFPDNTEIEATLTYSPNDRSRLSLEAVPDQRFIAVGLHYSFTRLPAVPMAPRYADNRVGYFLEAHKDFDRDDKENFWLRYVNRWRLEKKDPSAALSEPVKPIVYYLDKTIPEKFRPWVREGIENWQRAYEAAGFKNAIIAKDVPADDPDWDAEDVRYSTIRWITSTQPAFGAIGPSRVDPRTGEILDSDILFEASMLQNYANSYRRFAGPEDLAKSTLPQFALEGLPEGFTLEQLCMAGQATADAGAVQHMALLMGGTLTPGSPVPDEFMHPATVWVTMHEVGHALGLRHNFRSSTSTPREHLHDVAWTKQNGLYSSVMEYPTPNIEPSHTKQGQYYTTTPGTYDVWAIRYGYTPSGAATPDADYAFARKIADESLQPGHEYSTDEDTYPAFATDPRSNIYDLGNDPLAYARERTAYMAKLWRDPKFEDRIVGASGDLQALRRAMDTALQQYGIAAGMAVKYMGGSYLSRIERGQPLERDPVIPVPAAQQREALDFLGSAVWAHDAMRAPPALLSRLAPNRWSHWGMGAGTFAERQDYAWNDRVLAVQTTMLNAVTQPALLARMSESETRSTAPYRMSEHFDRLTRTIWGEVGGTAPAAFAALEGPNTRRDLQRAFIERMSGMVASPAAGTPDDARALARLALSRVDQRCARVLASGVALGDNTRAHLMESRARVKAALDATRNIETARPAGMGGAFGSSSN